MGAYSRLTSEIMISLGSVSHTEHKNMSAYPDLTELRLQEEFAYKLRQLGAEDFKVP